MAESNIKYLFNPRSVAIIGASHKQNKIGYKITDNIVYSKYAGKIYPVNPKGGKICGLKVYKNLLEINDEIDLAIVCVPAELTYKVIQDCPAKKVKFLLIITSGFSEIGKVKEEKEIVTFARQHGMRVLGPNIFGIYSAKASLNATFGQKNIKQGNAAIITQSGALGIALMGKTETEGISLSVMISEGNKADLDEVDFLEYLEKDDSTKVIFMYLEGITNGPDLCQILKKITRKKPVIVVKAGVSEKGAIAAASHTGSLAGSEQITSSILKQCGVIRAETLDEAIKWLKFLAHSPLPKGENSVIITNGGGIGVLATDACEKYQVNLYDDQKKLKEMFSSVVPSFGSTKNPIDLTGQGGASHYEKALNEVIINNDIHSIVCLGCQTALLNTEKVGRLVFDTYQKIKKVKPAVFAFVGGQKMENDLLSLKKQGVPIFGEVNEAISCLGSLYQYYRYLNSPIDEEINFKINLGEVKDIINKVKKEKRNFLLPDEAKILMDLIGISMPKNLIARNISEAIRMAQEIGYPLVAKVVSRGIIHKFDAGGVVLNIKNKEEIKKAYEQIVKNCQTYHPKAKIEGIELCEMIKPGLETIIGAKKDEVFGQIIMFGLGGVYVEVLKDVVFKALPIGKLEAENLIKGIKSYPLLTGVRGQKPKDIRGVIEVILKIANLIQKTPEIADIEINPLVVFEKDQGVKALDVRILLNL